MKTVFQEIYAQSQILLLNAATQMIVGFGQIFVQITADDGELNFQHECDQRVREHYKANLDEGRYFKRFPQLQIVRRAFLQIRHYGVDIQKVDDLLLESFAQRNYGFIAGNLDRIEVPLATDILEIVADFVFLIRLENRFAHVENSDRASENDAGDDELSAMSIQERFQTSEQLHGFSEWTCPET